MSKVEELLRAILTDSGVPEVEIISRVDKYLTACCEKCGCEGLPTPITRIDHLLYLLADELAGGEVVTHKPYVDTTKLTNLDSFCKGGKNIAFGLDPNLDTKNVTSMLDMFHSCSTIVHAPQLDTRNVTNMQSLFYGCINMQDVSVLDTNKATTFFYLFGNCPKLKTITPILNGDLVVNMDNMFDNDVELVDVRFKENSICVWLDIHWSTKLSRESILSILKGLRLTLADRHLKLPSNVEQTILNDAELNTAYQNGLNAGWIIEFI